MSLPYDILVACEESGTVREAFKQRGWNAYSCDLQDTEVPGQHIKGDVSSFLDFGWDLLIGHPPCRYLAHSGVQWLVCNPQRWKDMDSGVAFFLHLWNAPVPHICLENSVMHKYALAEVKIQPTQNIQPWMFGHTESKETCLWLKNLPSLKETNNVYDEMMKLPISERQRIFWTPPGPEREKQRSKTFAGIAAAMAEQWTAFFLENAFPPCPNKKGILLRKQQPQPSLL